MTQGVVLRDVSEEDLPVLFDHQSDPVANRMAAFAPRDWEAFLSHWARILADETVLKKAILFDDLVAGNVVSFDRCRDREVGYWLGREYWDRGIATRALLAFLDRVETRRPILARVARHNAASKRVLEKCGFKFLRSEMAPGDADGTNVEEIILRLEANAGKPTH